MLFPSTAQFMVNTQHDRGNCEGIKKENLDFKHTPKEGTWLFKTAPHNTATVEGISDTF